MRGLLVYAIGISYLLNACQYSKPKQEQANRLNNQNNLSLQNFACEMCNPSLIYGTSIGELIQQLYKQGQWDQLLRFISRKSILKFGEDEIVQSFKRTEFAYEVKLKSKTIMSDGMIQLNYQTVKFGTIGVLRMIVVIENDTCKVLINDVNPTITF